MKHSLSQYIEFGSSISLPFDQLEAGNLALHLSLPGYTLVREALSRARREPFVFSESRPWPHHLV